MSDASLWPTPWVRAALDLAILGVLTESSKHGYALAQSLRDRGFGLLRGGSLYPALARLQEAGYVQAAWVDVENGPGRKDYRLTSQGRRHLAEGLASWSDLTDTLRIQQEEI